MKCSKIGILGIFVTCALAAMPVVHATSSDSAQASESTEDAGAKIYNCAVGMESILPGDYYACIAKYYFQRNHYGYAVEMLEEAAHWANKDAQYALGLIYFNGDTPGIPANRPLAIAWLELSAERRNPTYEQAYSAARMKCNPAEIQAATRLLRKMNREYSDKVAGVRALRRFNQEIVPLEESASYGGVVHIDGYSPFPETMFTIVKQLHAQADKDFDGLIGTVTVGDLQEK